ncbi:MAG TPA: helix-turn-helix transcriptional regulator [Pirellulales bacterium]|nr:helix-turn-helix transcriptional regulator [Pirellulales bacterium]
MAKKGRDLSRGRELTTEEAARYAKIRQEVTEEIPPAKSNLVRETIGKLRLLREERGLSLADVEEQTGMTRANLCRLENEGRNIQLRTLERYARALGCRIEIGLVPIAAKRQARV